MAVVKPVMFTSIEDTEVAKDRPVSEELVRKMIQNCNLLGELAKIGSIQFVQINLDNAPQVNPDILQLANGGEITQVDSPLKTVVPTNRYTPDMKDKFVRGSPDLSNNTIGGSATTNLSHAHGTGDGGVGGMVNDGDDSSTYNTPFHTHGVTAALSSAESLEPSHQQLAVYIRIN